MGRRLESIKPSLDWNVEKDGAKEIDYDKDSYDYLFDEDELFMIKQMQLREELIAEGFLEDDDKLAKREMDEMISQSSWDSTDLGRYTINTPTHEKTEESMEESGMQIFDEEEFKRAVEEFEKTLEEGDPIREETNAQINRIMQQMELDW